MIFTQSKGRFASVVVLVAAIWSSPQARAEASCPSDMKEVHVGNAVSCVPEPENIARARDQLKTDPRFAEMLKGKWDFIHPDKAKPGEFCSAIFQNQEAMIWLLGPGAEYRGALMRFYGANIPKPKNTDKTGLARQKITLTQAPDPAQTLTVMSHAYPEFPFGVLTIPVPSLEALLGAMTDKQDFMIEIDGRVVFHSAWRDGLAARDALKKCARAK